MTLDRSLLPFKAFYFFVYAGMAAFMPFLTLYYESLGLTGQQIGFLAAIPPFITFLSAPFFGFLADLTQRPKLLLGISIGSVTLSIWGLTRVDSYWHLLLIVIFYALFFAPILPIVDRAVLGALGARKDQYGKQRLWGAIGWGVAAPVVGSLVDWGGLAWAFYAGVILFLGLFALTGLMPASVERGPETFLRGVRQLLGRWPVMLFFAVALAGGIGSALIHHYLFLHLAQLGASNLMMGWALSIATISELIVMYFSDRLLRWWGARGLLGFALAALGLRLLAMSAANAPEWVLLIQLFHGPTFAGLWMAAVAYVSEIAPPGLANTTQGLLTGVVMGLGSTLGAFFGGLLYTSVGFSLMFRWAGIGIFLIVILFMFVSTRFSGSAAQAA